MLQEALDEVWTTSGSKLLDCALVNDSVAIENRGGGSGVKEVGEAVRVGLLADGDFNPGDKGVVDYGCWGRRSGVSSVRGEGDRTDSGDDFRVPR